MRRLERLSLYFHTIKRLKIAQIYHQLLYKLGTWKTYRVSEIIPTPSDKFHLLVPQLDESAAYLSRFDTASLVAGKIRLLHAEYEFPWGVWQCDNASALFNFNLHYHEFLIALAIDILNTGSNEHLALFERLINDWLDTCCKIPAKPGRHRMQRGWYNAWAPYTISLRAINWLICMDALGNRLSTKTRQRMNQALFVQYQYLLNNPEKRVLANHYFENLKTLYILSLYFKDATTEKAVEIKLCEQVAEQILPSGLHFERSPMYHRVLLEGLLRVIVAVRQTDTNCSKALLHAAQQMLSYTMWLEEGLNRTPLFNDAGDNVAKSPDDLCAAAKEILNINPQPIVQPQGRGYHVFNMKESNVRAIVDADELGPSYMLGHSHCDCLSFEIFMDGTPLFVNAGTYQYQGPLRQLFRATLAHNTAMLGDNEQARCWGEHRVAQSCKVLQVERTVAKLTGRYCTWQGVQHHRVFSIEGTELSVLDSFTGAGDGIIRSCLRVAPGFDVSQKADNTLLVSSNGQSICTIYPVRSKAALYHDGEKCYYSPEFGLLLQCTLIEFSWAKQGEPGGYRINFNPKESRIHG